MTQKTKRTGEAVAAYQKRRSAQMKAAVENYFRVNPFMTVKDCIRDLGFSQGSVHRYLRELREEARSSTSRSS